MSILNDEWIQKYEMLHPCDLVVAGVSGGADSLALLHFLKFGLGEYRLRLLACHVNHGLRGAESLRDQQHVEQICQEWGVSLHVEQVDVKAIAQAEKVGLEEAGRTARYEIFSRLAGTEGKIVTAHTASDNYETMLFHLSRGAGLAGMCGIQPVRGNIIRPLLGATRQEIEAYCRENQIIYITDSTNFDNIYARNKIRIEIVPKLKELNPRAERLAVQSASLLLQDEEFLNRLAAQNKKECSQAESIQLRRLSAEPAIRSRVLMLWLKEQGVSYDYDLLHRMLEMVNRGSGKLNLCGGLYCKASAELLFLEKKTEHTPFFEFPLELEKDYEMPSGARYCFHLIPKEERSRIQEIFKKSTYKCIDYGKIIGKLKIRQRQEGDKIRIFERNITKSIKKLMNEAKIPPEIREKIFLLCDECGIIYVESLATAERAAPDSDTGQYLVIEKKFAPLV